MPLKIELVLDDRSDLSEMVKKIEVLLTDNEMTDALGVIYYISLPEAQELVISYDYRPGRVRIINPGNRQSS